VILMGPMEDIFGRVAYKLYHTSSSERFVRYLRRLGMRIGDGVTIFAPRLTFIDQSNPSLITLGNKVKITQGVRLVTHGFDWSVLREVYHRPFASAGEIVIGDNVFIGFNTIVLKNVRIGSNVVIGAGSIVTKDIPPDSVAAGNPAKVICSIEDHHKRYVEREVSEARMLFENITKKYGRDPTWREMREFFFLFSPRDGSVKENSYYRHQIGDHMEEFMRTEPSFGSFDEMLEEFRRGEG